MTSKMFPRPNFGSAILMVICTFTVVQADWMHPKFERQSERILTTNDDDEIRPYQVEDKEYWFSDAQATLNSKINEPKIEQVAKNIIFFLGDGMSVSTVTAARILKGQLAGQPGEEAQLHFNTFPHIGVSRTFCTDSQVADSACSATAYLCGTKANDGTIGVTPFVLRRNCTAQMDPANQVTSILYWAQRAGKATGVVTTTRITHASPAGTYAHIADRDWENDAVIRRHGEDPDECDDIAEQLILREPGRNIDVILGGGRREFLPNTTADIENNGTFGSRTDGENLIEKWQKMNSNNESKYIFHRDELLGLDTENINKVLGLFNHNHLGYLDEQFDENDPSLEEMTKVAIKILSKNPNGFFLFVEGGRIDHAHHESMAQRALLETIEFDKAIQAADNLTRDEDTLILVTSDHSHTMTINGYPDRGNPIFGVALNGDDGLPYSTLSYANGPGYTPDILNETGTGVVRYNISEDDLDDIEYRQISTVPLSSETHGGDDVLIFSKGPFAHLLTGVQMQSYIPHVLGYASCTGDGVRFQGCTSTSNADVLRSSLALGICLLTLSYFNTN